MSEIPVSSYRFGARFETDGTVGNQASKMPCPIPGLVTAAA